MLQRCYSVKSHKKYLTYKDCSVCPEWLYFSVFRAWMQAHDGHREGLDLYKDILVFGNKLYSPQTCLFVPESVNRLLLGCKAKRGEWPQGVVWNAQKFQSQINIDGKLKNLGYFDSADEAEEAYRAAKSENIYRTINLLPAGQYHEPTRQALARIADNQFSPRCNDIYNRTIELKKARDDAVEKRKASCGDLPKGVYEQNGRYAARMNIGGMEVHLGIFDTPEEAVEAIRIAKSAPEGVETCIAALVEKRKIKAAQRGLPTGVSEQYGRYKASIRIDGKLVYLGTFDTPDEAGEAYRISRMKNPPQCDVTDLV